MALSTFSHHHGRKGRGGGGGGGGADVWDVIDPLEIALTMLEDAPTLARARDTRAITNTNVDWVETPEAHIFKVDLPGNNLFVGDESAYKRYSGFLCVYVRTVLQCLVYC
jgi:hypothetical protein